MFTRNTDAEWKKYGDDDPYYGVVSLDKFHKGKLDAAAIDEFFQSGRHHVHYTFEMIRKHLDPHFTRAQRALDFGCGVGRCLIPLAALSDVAIGVDVSEAMLDETRKNAAAQSIDNLELLLSDDTLSKVPGSFDLVHSFAVFQHIPPARGEKLLAHLLALLNEGGVLAIQFIYDRQASRAVKAMGWLRKRIPLLHPLANLLCGEKPSKPLMEKNCYNLNRLMNLLRAAGCPNVHIEFEGKGKIQSLILFARKDRRAEIYDYEALFA